MSQENISSVVDMPEDNIPLFGRSQSLTPSSEENNSNSIYREDSPPEDLRDAQYDNDSSEENHAPEDELKDVHHYKRIHDNDDMPIKKTKGRDVGVQVDVELGLNNPDDVPLVTFNPVLRFDEDEKILTGRPDSPLRLVKDGNSDYLLMKPKADKTDLTVKSKPAEGSSFGASVFNMMNAVIGSGVLGLAYAMSNSGIIMFTAMMLIVGVLADYSICLMLKTSDITRLKSYEDIGFRAFGKVGKSTVAVAVFLQNVGGMCSYLYIIKTELPEIFRVMLGANLDVEPWYLNGDYLCLFAVIFLIFPLCALPKIGFLGYTSGMAIVLMSFFTIVVIVKLWDVPCPIPIYEGHGPPYESKGLDDDRSMLEDDSVPVLVGQALSTTVLTTLVNSTAGSMVAESLPSFAHLIGTHDNGTDDDGACEVGYFIINKDTAYTIPTISFAFVCHTAVLPIYAELKQASRQKMQWVTHTALSASGLMYFLAALFGYLTFKSEVFSELLHSYVMYDPYDILILVVRLAVCFAVIFTVPILQFPTRDSITTMFFNNRPFSWLRYFLITIGIISLVTCLALFVPDIREIFGFTGATASTMLVFILPSAFYVVIGQEPLKSKEKILPIVMIVVGVIVFVVSVILMIYNWVSEGH